jgi:hypothetical protein
MLKTVTVFAAAAAALACSLPAMAETSAYATLTSVKGSVFVDVGEGFKSVDAATPVGLHLGDRVMVTKGGSATLKYGLNCSVPLLSPSMTTVAETACLVSTQGDAAGSTTSLGMLTMVAGSLGGPLAGLTNSVVESQQNEENPPPVSP